MPVHKTTLTVLALGFLVCASNELTANRTAYCKSQPSSLPDRTPAYAVDSHTFQQEQKALAEKALADGKQLEAQGTADSLRKALVSFEKALALWRSLSNKQGEGETLDHIGVVHYLLDERQKALEDFEQELRVWRAVGDQQNEAEALNNLGVVYGSLGQEQKSIEYYQQALPLRRAIGDRRGIANSLDNIGLSYLSAGELTKALDSLTQALGLFRELNERAGVANTLNNIGGVHMTWGDYRKSLEYFDQALELRRVLGHRREEAIALNNIAHVFLMIGEAQKAMDYNRQALELRRSLGLPSGEAASLNNIGFVYDSLGEKQKALEHYKQALDLFRSASDQNGEASALNNIGSYHLYTLKEPQTALQYHIQALEIRRALGQRFAEATELENIGYAHKTLGNRKKALEYHREALEINTKLGNRIGEGASLANLGSISYETGEYQTALDYFTKALAIHRAMESRPMEASTLYGLALIERARGNLDQARLRIEESLNIIESLRGKVASQDLRASYLAQQQDYYEFYTDLLIRLQQREPSRLYDVAALQASERSRSRSLLELLAEARINVEQGIAPELKQRERATHTRIAWIQSRLIQAHAQAKPDKDKISALEKEMKKVDTELEQLTMEIRQKHPRYAELQYPSPLGLRGIQSLLDERTVLFEYAIGKEASFLFAVTSNEFQVARVPSSSSITEQVQALRLAITVRPQRNMLVKQIDHSRWLYHELVEPAARLLSGKQNLIIVPSGILHYLPFEVLLSSGNAKTLATEGSPDWPYLVRNYAISYVPSASVLASLRKLSDPAAEHRRAFLAFADPFYRDDAAAEDNLVRSSLRSAFGDERAWKLDRLPESRREVEQIAGLYPRDQVSLLLGQQANEENVKTSGRLSQYRFIHFATHGLLNEQRPPYSGLVLSRSSLGTGVSTRNSGQSGLSPAQGSPNTTSSNRQFEDGLLQAYEVFNLKLNADLVVLSACETGLGKEVKGEGLIGLTHAFFYAGTPSVVVSLWNVQDRSTADLMVNFYQHLDRVPDKAEALRRAKLKLIRSGRYASPYYWAPFILVGRQ